MLQYSQSTNDIIHPLLVPWCINLAIYDLLFNTIRRAIKFKNPFKPDGYHLHHRLLKIGFSQKNVLIIILISQVLLTTIGYLIFKNIGQLFSLTTFVVMFFVYFYILVFIKRFFKSEKLDQIDFF